MVLNSRADIEKMLNMECRHDKIVDVVNYFPINEDKRNKRNQTPKYTILNNGSYYLHHYWYKKQKVMETVAAPFPQYGHDGVDSN